MPTGPMYACVRSGCKQLTVSKKSLCSNCKADSIVVMDESSDILEVTKALKTKPSELYPKYYKSTEGLTDVDVYAVHKLFNIQDPSGAIQHASKKLLLSGVRTGGKSQADDIREARDTLTRWLELYS